MASRKQAEANRRNAKKSTGPRTANGKKKVRLNAIKHGLSSPQPCLPEEIPPDLQRILDDLNREYLLEGEPGEAIVEHIALGIWRLQYADGLETAIISREYNELADRLPEQIDALAEAMLPAAKFCFGLSQRSQNSPKLSEEDHKICLEAEAWTKRAAEAALGGQSTLGKVFVEGPRIFETLARISRYRTAIYRRLCDDYSKIQSHGPPDS